MGDWPAYARDRKGLNYYRVVRAYVESCSPGESILDVGCGGTDVVYYGEFDRRDAINKQPIDPNHYPGVNLLIGNWLDIQPPVDRYSAVTCCQVLEHLPDPILFRFAAKLKEAADNLIVSVPYMWPEGLCHYHVQDPVGMAALELWLGKPTTHEIVYDGKRARLVALYQKGDSTHA